MADTITSTILSQLVTRSLSCNYGQAWISQAKVNRQQVLLLELVSQRARWVSQQIREGLLRKQIWFYRDSQDLDTLWTSQSRLVFTGGLKEGLISLLEIHFRMCFISGALPLLEVTKERKILTRLRQKYYPSSLGTQIPVYSRTMDGNIEPELHSSRLQSKQFKLISERVNLSTRSFWRSAILVAVEAGHSLTSWDRVQRQSEPDWIGALSVSDKKVSNACCRLIYFVSSW